VRSETEVKNWYNRTPNFAWVLERVGVMMLKSVGISEYVSHKVLTSSEFDMLIVEFLAQHTSILDHLIQSPHNLFSILADLSTTMVMTLPLAYN
jgi:EamA domain-containing membrane protein RarD